MVWIQVDTAHQMARLHGFGRLIGSSDMHAGNLGVLLTDTGPRVLAPAYDMLPVSLAPSNTGALRSAAALQLSAPECAGQVPPIGSAAEKAERFWEDAAASEVIRSEPLRALGGRTARTSHATRQALHAA